MLLLLTTSVLLLLVRSVRGACDCYGCTSTVTVSTNAWLPAPSACSDPSHALAVSNLRIASTDDSTFDVRGWTNSSLEYYYTALSDSGVTCFNLGADTDVGVTADMRLQVTCKNQFFTCPLTYEVQYACRKLDPCSCPTCTDNTTVPAGTSDELSPNLKCTNGLYLEKLQVRALNAGRTVSPDLFTVRVRTARDATTYAIGPSLLEPNSCFSYTNPPGDYIDSANVYIYVKCENAERPCLLEFVGRARCRDPLTTTSAPTTTSAAVRTGGPGATSTPAKTSAAAPRVGPGAAALLFGVGLALLT